VTGVLGGLRDDVQQHPPRRPRRARLEPWCRGQRLQGIQVRQRPHELVGLGRDLVVLLEQASQGLAIEHLERARPGLSGRRRIELHDLRSLDDESRPLPLGERDVLDQPAEAELADRRAARRLLVIQPAGGEPQEVPLLGQRGQQVGALARHALRSAHGLGLSLGRLLGSTLRSGADSAGRLSRVRNALPPPLVAC